MYQITPGSRENGIVKASLGFNTITHRPLKFRVFEGPVGSLVMPKDGLVFYAPLKDNSATAATRQTLISSNVSYTTVGGVPCCLFSGNNSSYIFSSDNTNLPLSNQPSTLSCWFRLKDTNNTNQMFFAYGSGSNDSMRGLCCFQGSSRYFASALWGASGDNMSNVQAELNKWYHVACIFGDNYQKLYLNGSLIKELSYSGMNTSFEKISLGGYFYAGGSTLQEYCNCYLASARIYNRVLTQDEITLLSREFDNAFLVFDMDAKKGIQDNSDNPCTPENHGVTIQDGCFVFDGNSYITTSQASKLNLGTGDFTIEVVLNLSTGNSNKPYPTILGGKDGWDYGANGLRWNGTHHRNGFAAFLNPSDPLMRSNTTFTPNDNTFITYTVQRRSGVWEQYFDGVKDSTTVSNSQEYNLCHNSGMCIGCSLWDGSNGYHIGLIKSVKIWNKARYQ